MANPLSLLKPTAKPTMNLFDLSQKHVHSGVSGRIDSVLQVETVPKDKFEIDMSSLMRTMTFNTASFLRGKQTFDFYFVPYSQIWHPFNQFIQQRKDVHSSLQKGTSYVPVIHLKSLLHVIGQMFLYTANGVNFDGKKDIHGVNWCDNVFRMLDFFGFGSYYWLEDELKKLKGDSSEYDTNIMNWYESNIARYDGKYLNIFRPAAYQHTWYDFYRNKFYDNYEYEEGNDFSDYVLSFNFDDISCRTFAQSIIPIDETLLDDGELSVNNRRVVMLFAQRYIQYKQDLFQSLLPSQQFGAVSSVNIDLSGISIVGEPGAGTLALGGPNYDSISSDGENASKPYYRDTQGNTVISQLSDASLYGDIDGNVYIDYGENHLGQIRTPHYHNLSGSPSKGTLSINGVSNTSIDVLAIKRAEALQKWRQNALRAGNMVDDGFRAHYGVTPRYESDNNVLKLGSFEATLNVNPVETTAISSEAGNNKVGDLGATGISVVTGNKIRFDCSDFGTIIVMSYFRPESEYNNMGIDKANRLNEPFDFFTEEFMNIGLDTVNLVDYCANLNISLDTVFGYSSQYWWLKTALDKCHQEFQRLNYQTSGDSQLKENNGSLLPWVAPRNLVIHEWSGQAFRNLSTLYVNPSVLDDVFGVHYNDGLTESGELQMIVDTFVFNTYFDIKAIRPMTEIGLPNF